MYIIIIKINLVVKSPFLRLSFKCHPDAVLKWRMKRNRCTCESVRRSETRGTMLSTAGWPITAPACGGKKSRHPRLERPWCPSAVDVNLRVWSSPLGGPWALWSHASPPRFNRQPCLGPALAFFPGRIREQLWWTSPSPCSLYYFSFSFFVVLSLSLHTVHSQELRALCITFSIFLSISTPPLKAHTVQQHLPLCLFNLLSLFDI